MQVVTDAPGTDAATVERTITIPLENVLVGLPGQTRIRSTSQADRSVITIEVSGDTLAARREIVAKIQAVELPAGVTPELGAVTRSDGVVLRYVLRSHTRPVGSVRELQDWTIRARLLKVTGIADVSSLGGVVDRVNITPDPAKLAATFITIDDVATAVGRELSTPHGGSMREALPSITVAIIHGTPVRVSDVARVEDGNAPRDSYVLEGSDELVEGIVWLRAGADRDAARRDVEHALEDIQRTLPSGDELAIVADAASGTLAIPSATLADQIAAVRAVSSLAPHAIFELGRADGGFFADNADEVHVRFASAEAKTAFVAAVANRPGMMWIGDDTVWVELAGDDVSGLAELTKTLHVLERVGIERVPLVVPRLDRARAATLGVALGDAQSTLGYAPGRIVGQIDRDEGHRIDVAVVIDALAPVSVRSHDGALIPLSSIATFARETVPREILRDRSRRWAAVRVMGDAARVRADLAKVPLPSGVELTVAAP